MGNSLTTSWEFFPYPVHPHVCGELWLCIKRRRNRIGSSPRVWGTQLQAILIRKLLRFIPTCVGNSYSKITTVFEASVHPHVCGELFSASDSTVKWFGSSPRVWGTLKSLSNLAAFFRFIPTCVGNSVNNSDEKIKLTVHPHVCGELVCCGCFTCYGDGSSPRVWGTRHQWGWL